MNILALAALSAAGCAGLIGDDLSYCRALESGQSSWCQSILDPDTRLTCGAEVSGDQYICDSVANPLGRTVCRVRSAGSVRRESH